MPGISLQQTDNCALVLVCKRPRLGVSKQRIAADLGPHTALAISHHLHACALEDIRDWPGATVICIADAADARWALEQSSASTIISQCAGNLGQRLEGAWHDLSGRFRRALFIGSDAPTLTTDYLMACAHALDGSDVVLGGAVDGGVVAMGSRRGWPPLTGLPWSTPRLGAALADACEQQGMRVDWQRTHADVDDADQLQALYDQLSDDARPARRAMRDWLTDFLDGAERAAQMRI